MDVDELVRRGHDAASKEAVKALAKMLRCPVGFELHDGDVKAIPRFLGVAADEATVVVVLSSFLVGEIEGTSYYILSREASFQVCQRLLKKDKGGAPSTRFSYGGRTGCPGGTGQHGHGELFAGIFVRLGLDPCCTPSSAFLLERLGFDGRWNNFALESRLSGGSGRRDVFQSFAWRGENLSDAAF